MMKIILKDSQNIWRQLLPLTYSRPVGALRCGIFTIGECWRKLLGPDESEIYYDSEEYLRGVWPYAGDADEETVKVDSSVLPTAALASFVKALRPGARIEDVGGNILAVKGTGDGEAVKIDSEVKRIAYPYDIFLNNPQRIVHDFGLIDLMPVPECGPDVRIIGPAENIKIHPSARLCACVINASEGPVYIGPYTRVMENAVLRGPVAVCSGSQVMMAARLYDGVTLGPRCKVGGEVDDTVFQGFSNKAHEGYLGNAVVGEWCNIGAGANASNLKNDYTPIKLWDYGSGHFRRTGLQFCGLILGDHTKVGVGMMLNTATMVGVACNLHGPGFPRNFVKSFQDGGASGFTQPGFAAWQRTATAVMGRRDIALTPQYLALWQHIFSLAPEIEK